MEIDAMNAHRAEKARQGFRLVWLSGLLVVCLAVASCVHRNALAWNEYKVFCGMSYQDGEVTEEEWLRFCDEHVTVAFPDGYTTFEATGNWKGDADETTRENTRVLLIVAPPDAKDKVLSLAQKYRELFNQEAVLVVTTAGEATFVEENP